MHNSFIFIHTTLTGNVSFSHYLDLPLSGAIVEKGIAENDQTLLQKL
jgi:hypothetical protein